MTHYEKFEIKIPHFYCLEYIEGEKKMTIEIDFRDTAIYLSSDLIEKWEAPHNEEIVDEQKKVEIINNISNYLKNIKGFKNVNVEI